MSGVVEVADASTADKQCEDAIASICAHVLEKKDGRPLRIVVLGKHGSGKSSFINGVAAALSRNRWREFACTGNSGDGVPVTILTQKLEKCCNERTARYKSVPLPTLIDVAGAMDIDDSRLVELFRLLFYGHLQEESSIMAAYEFCRDEQHSIPMIRKRYSQAFPDMRVDRVVFVASAVDPIPEKLISCVMRAARPDHLAGVTRTIPVHGVMTKKDRVKDVNSSEFREKKEKFMRRLGLHNNRFLFCSNYCDDTDPDSMRTIRVDPSLDLPILNFFRELCDPAAKVQRDKEELPGTRGFFSRTCGFVFKSLAVALVAVLVCCFLRPAPDNPVKKLGVTPLSLGVSSGADNVMKVIIERNTPIPTSQSMTFTTRFDSQMSVVFPVKMGERPLGKKNKHLGDVILKGLDPAPRDVPEIEVTFAIDVDGVLTVRAQDKDSGKEVQVTFDSYMRGLTQENIRRSIDDAETYKEEDGKQMAKSASKMALEEYAYRTKRAVLNEKVKAKVSEKDVKTVLDACDDTLLWIEVDGKDADKSDFDNKLRELQRVFDPILTSLYKNL